MADSELYLFKNTADPRGLPYDRRRFPVPSRLD